MNKPESYQFSSMEDYAIAMIMFNGSNEVCKSYTRYLWDMLPTIYITRHKLIRLVGREHSVFGSGLNLSKWTLDNTLLYGD